MNYWSGNTPMSVERCGAGRVGGVGKSWRPGDEQGLRANRAHGNRLWTVLRLGVSGVRAQITVYRAALNPARAEDIARDDFYRACLEALDGMLMLSRRYAEHAEGWRRQPHRNGPRNCGRSPDLPQSARIAGDNLRGGHAGGALRHLLPSRESAVALSVGRPERYLLPYYRRDIAAGP